MYKEALKLKFDFDFKEFFIHRKKEILVIALYTLLFVSVVSFINKLNIDIETAEFDRNLAERQYNNIKNSNLSEDVLANELREITIQAEELSRKLPANLDHMEINKMLSEISRANGGLFTLGNCKITQIERKDGYASFEVKVNSVRSNYNQFKNFVEYIEKYKSKVILSQVDLNRTSSEVQGSMTLVFFGEKKVGEKI